MTIAVKYCGGCNPQFERRDIVTQLEADHPEFQIVNLGNAPADFIIIICGCHRACANAGEHTAKLGCMKIVRMEDYAQLTAFFDNLSYKGE